MLKAWNRLTAIHAPLLITAIAMISACVESGAEPMAEAQSPAAQPPATARPATPPPAPPAAAQTPPTYLGAPPVQFEPATLDLGTLKPGAQASGVVMIHNISDKWLTIKASKSSCTCTAINLANTTIAPGQAIPLDVGYHASSNMGAKNAAVRILFEGYDLVEVPIVAFVGLPVRTEPMYVDALLKANGTQALTGQFTVFSVDQKPFKVLSMNGKPPRFADVNPAGDEARNSHVLKWDLTEFDPTNNCRNAAGERLPGWIVVETDHPEAPILDLEVRHECNRRKPVLPMDTWVASDKRVLLGAVKPGEPVETSVLLKWLPERQHDFPPTAVVSETPDQFSASIVDVKPEDDGLLVRLKITPGKNAKGLIYGSLRLHSNRQTGQPVCVIATVR